MKGTIEVTKPYKLRAVKNAAHTNYRLTVPTWLASRLDPGQQFEFAVTDRGFLYRALDDARVPTSRPYKVSSFANGRARSGRPHYVYSITVPTHVGIKFAGQEFGFEPCAGGFRYTEVAPAPVVELPTWIRPTFATELARLDTEEMLRDVFFTRNVVSEHQAEYGLATYDCGLRDLFDCARQGRVTTEAPEWCEEARDDAALLVVGEELALVIARGHRHAAGETWLKPYVALRAYYGPSAGAASALGVAA